MNELFRQLARTASEAAGSPWAFIGATLVFRNQNTQNLENPAEVEPA